MKILFVCLGNTCRSPMAECLLSHLIEFYGLDWETDSAALRIWNVGQKPNERCLKVLSENGLSTAHCGRMVFVRAALHYHCLSYRNVGKLKFVQQITPEDFQNFDLIFGMDELNMDELRLMSKNCNGKAKIELLGTYIGREEDKEISDPYFSTGAGGFRCAYLQIKESLQNFIKLQSDQI